MTGYDIASIYYYIRSLGPAGKLALDFTPSGKLAPPPSLRLVTPSPTATAEGR